MNKKIILLIPIIMIGVIASSAYITYETSPVELVTASTMQLAGGSYEDRVDRQKIIVLGTIQDITPVLVTQKHMDTDGVGNEFMQTYEVPYHQITINIEETLKGSEHIVGSTVTFVEEVNGIGTTGGVKTQFVGEYNMINHVGDRAIFFINDSPYGLEGYSHVGKFEITTDASGNENIASEMDHQMNEPEIPLTQAIAITKEKAKNLND